MTNAIDRRASPRYSTAHSQTYVQLIAGFGWRIEKAKLVNISHPWALILTDYVAVLREKLEVRLDDAPEIGWIEAEAVRFGQPHEVGIRFDRPCDHHVLEAAIGGVVHIGPRESDAEPTEASEPELARGGPASPFGSCPAPR